MEFYMNHCSYCRERRELLIKCAATSLNSKLISHRKCIPDAYWSDYLRVYSVMIKTNIYPCSPRDQPLQLSFWAEDHQHERMHIHVLFFSSSARNDAMLCVWNTHVYIHTPAHCTTHVRNAPRMLHHAHAHTHTTALAKDSSSCGFVFWGVTVYARNMRMNLVFWGVNVYVWNTRMNLHASAQYHSVEDLTLVCVCIHVFVQKIHGYSYVCVYMYVCRKYMAIRMCVYICMCAENTWLCMRSSHVFPVCVHIEQNIHMYTHMYTYIYVHNNHTHKRKWKKFCALLLLSMLLWVKISYLWYTCTHIYTHLHTYRKSVLRPYCSRRGNVSRWGLEFGHDWRKESTWRHSWGWNSSKYIYIYIYI